MTEQMECSLILADTHIFVLEREITINEKVDPISFIPRRPKSPPNSPNPELADISEELKGVYINRLCDGSSGSGATSVANNGQTSVTASELIWDWSSRPNVPPRYLYTGREGGSTIYDV